MERATIDLPGTLRSIEAAINKVASIEHLDAGVHVLKSAIAAWKKSTFPDPTGPAQIADALDDISDQLATAADAAPQHVFANAYDRARRFAHDEAIKFRAYRDSAAPT